MGNDSDYANKYPSYLMGLIAVYVVLLGISISILPSAFYNLNNIFFIILMVLPLGVIAVYFFEKPRINPRYLRYVFLALLALFFFFQFIILYIFF